jgi:TrwC relaxase/AAA domain
MAPAADGKWRALDGQLILQDWRQAAGYLYQARLRYELTRSLGVEWGEVTNGQADLAAVPQAVIDEFSTRRDTVIAHAHAMGDGGYRAQRVAQLVTRPDKVDFHWPTEVDRWRARAAEHGLGVREYAHVISGPRTPRAPDAHLVGEELLGPNGLTAHGQTFTHADLVKGWAAAHPEGGTAEGIRAHAETSLDAPEVLCAQPSALGRPARASTVEMLGVEDAALQAAVRGRDRGAARADGVCVDAAVRAHTHSLTREQERVARAVAMSPDRVACVVGAAGAGKTTAIAAGARALEAAGFAVVGDRALRPSRAHACRERPDRRAHPARVARGPARDPARVRRRGRRSVDGRHAHTRRPPQ